MSENNVCPECGNTLLKTANRCPCGWRYSESKKIDYRCSYTLGNRRCPSMGTSCPSVRGNIWYCSPHSQTLDNPARAELELIKAEENHKN